MKDLFEVRDGAFWDVNNDIIIVLYRSDLEGEWNQQSLISCYAFTTKRYHLKYNGKNSVETGLSYGAQIVEFS